MAYDHHVAICNPLLYNVVMGSKSSSRLMLGSYLMAFSGRCHGSHWIHAETGPSVRQTPSTIISVMSTSLLQLSFTSTYVKLFLQFSLCGHQHHCAQLTVFVSYCLIVTNSFSKSSPRRAGLKSSAPSSHIIAISLLGSCTFMYLKSSAGSLDKEKIIFYLLYECGYHG